ncbi:MAG: penicillin acylase family protein, partial [Gammaproteobacteria bacterium]|nr:penicillin acylase family protein [Gammaproteobacteria bacterium]
MKNNKKRQVFRTKKPSFLRRFFKLSLNIIISLVVIVGAAVYFILNASLPQYSGSTRVNGVQSPVTLNRDDLGTLEIIADNRLDAAFALGFSHAQERFFQMDLLRRSAAGELSAIIGPATLNLDRRNRLHRFRYRAEQVINQLPAQQRQLLATYTAGVNQGLAQLSTSPFEYWLLNSTPELWQIEDSVLVVYAMYLDLQDSRGLREQKLQQLFAATPSTLFRQLIPNRSIFDAPID